MKDTPCDMDHNGECLICDCWSTNCAWKRLVNNDYKYESREDLLKIFKDFIREKNIEELIKD